MRTLCNQAYVTVIDALASAWKCTLKPTHRAAGTFVHLNFLHVQRMHRKDVAMRFALRRRCTTVNRSGPKSVRV